MRHLISQVTTCAALTACNKKRVCECVRVCVCVCVWERESVLGWKENIRHHRKSSTSFKPLLPPCRGDSPPHTPSLLTHILYTHILSLSLNLHPLFHTHALNIHRLIHLHSRTPLFILPSHTHTHTHFCYTSAYTESFQKIPLLPRQFSHKAAINKTDSSSFFRTWQKNFISLK